MKEVPASSVILHTAAVTFWQRKIRDAFYENRNMHSICRILNLIHRYRRELKSQKEMVPVGVSKQIRSIPCLKNPQKKTEISVFERAGFTQELFIDYISSIVQRVGYMDYRGHENDKVLVVLPDQFRPAWNEPVEMVMLSRSLRQL